MEHPADLKYSVEHEWIRVDGDTGVVGITSFAAEQVGDIVFVELPAVGTAITQGKPFGVIESVKAVSELFAPVSGEVIEVNTALADAPEGVGEAPYGDGWLIKVKVTNPAELDSLMDVAAYIALLDNA
ncbi:MAG: glycine cleavage system protein GcvH [Gemmatimonadales bacterium]|jgi:glycine cleavage system H protein|nr:glycine cleavage system protein GcvH [Gemmatimonadales bacterium]MDZ4391270.1 glycine cleavage system protein GcvH [Gemmatimonadales bacterium]